MNSRIMILNDVRSPSSAERATRPFAPVVTGRGFYAVLALLAFMVRLIPVLIGHGLAATGRYDDSVYYAAADALTFGRVPYRQFVLLHPPGIMLALAPFALLGRATGDHTGMVLAQLAFMGIGAANTVLVAVIAGRWGRASSVVGGVMYACWLPAVYAEQATLLEPLGNLLLLGGTALLLNQPAPTSWKRTAAAGALVGCALTVKIWYAAPLLAVVAWVALVRGRRDALSVAGGAGLTAAAVLLPFFALAPRRMFDMVVRDQLSRTTSAAPRLSRLTSIVGTRTFLNAHSAGADAATLVLAAATLAAAVVCLRLDAQARLLALLLGTCLAVLLASPTYFTHYAELTAAPLALVVAVGVPHVVRRLPARPTWTITAIAVALAVVAVVHVSSQRAGHPVSWARLARAAPSGCLASDSPEPLIGMNRLSADLRAGCAVPVDVGGYGYDLLTRLHGKLVYVSRARNPAWQAFLYRYLTGARSFVLVRSRSEIMPSVYRALLAHRPLARANGFVLRAGAQ